MKKILVFIMLITIFIGIAVVSAHSQTTKTIGGSGSDYPNLRTAFLAINNGTITGDIVLQITGSTTETSSASLNGSGGTANYNTVTIYPTGAGYSITGNFANSLIDLNGADRVTIDGRVNQTGPADLIIANTGFASSAYKTFRFAGEATYNTLKYCIIKGACPSSGSGMISFSNSSTGTTGNSDNTIDHCVLTNAGTRPLNVIYSEGTSGRENRNNAITNNNFADFFNPDANSMGIYLGASSIAWHVEGNSFYETSASFAVTGDFTYKFIRISNTSGTGFTVTGNYFGGNQPQCGGAAFTKSNAFNNVFTGLELNLGSGTISSIQNNTFQNISWSNSGAAAWTGILVVAGDVNIGDTEGNTIGAATGNASVVVRAGNNGAIVTGIGVTGNGTVLCRNNTIGSITVETANPDHGVVFYGLYKSGSGGDLTFDGNTIGSLSTVNSIHLTSPSTANVQNMTGIYSAGSGNNVIMRNTVANLSNGTSNSLGTTSGKVNGILCTAGISNLVLANTISGLSNLNANTASDKDASVAGIVLTGISSIKTVSGNQISGLRNSNVNFEGTVTGIYFEGSTISSNLISENLIQNFETFNVSEGAGSNWTGILSGSGIGTFANNIVHLEGNTNAQISGIYVTASVNSNCKLYFNTVYIGGNTTGTQNSYALYSRLNNSERDYRNNILVNARSGTGTSSHYAFYNYQTGGTIVADYNNYYVNGTGGIPGYYGSNKTVLPIIPGQDGNSSISDPLFVAVGGNSAEDYKLTAEKTGISGTGITSDFGGHLRSSNPAMGAWEIIQSRWIGATNTDWNLASNWSLNNIPSASIDVVIPGSLVNYPLLSHLAQINNLEIQVGANLTIAPAGSLTVSEEITNLAGTQGLIIRSDASGTGSLRFNNTGIAATVQRYMTGNKWHHVSGPVIQPIQSFLTDPLNSVVPTNGNNRGMIDFNTVSGTNGAWNPFFTNETPGSTTAGKGFMLRTSENAPVSFKGNLNAGEITVTLNRENTAGWNSIGNPYSTAININPAAHVTNNVLSQNISKFDENYQAIYVWDESQTTPRYVPVNLADPLPFFAQLGQGFFVKPAAQGSSFLQFSPSMQVHQNNAVLKSTTGIAELSQINLEIANNGHVSSTGILMIPGTTLGLDKGYDAGIMKAYPDLALFTYLAEDNGTQFTRQCVPLELPNNFSIKLGLDCKQGGTIVFSARTGNLPIQYKVILEDTQTNLFTDLQAKDYTAAIDGNTIASNRFILHTSQVTSWMDYSINQQLSAFAIRNSEVKVNGLVSNDAVALLYDLQGRLVLKTKLNAGSQNELLLPELKTGVYLLQINDRSRVEKFKLVIRE